MRRPPLPRSRQLSPDPGRRGLQRCLLGFDSAGRGLGGTFRYSFPGSPARQRQRAGRPLFDVADAPDRAGLETFNWLGEVVPLGVRGGCRLGHAKEFSDLRKASKLVRGHTHMDKQKAPIYGAFAMGREGFEPSTSGLRDPGAARPAARARAASREAAAGAGGSDPARARSRVLPRAQWGAFFSRQRRCCAGIPSASRALNVPAAPGQAADGRAVDR
jgi:hypothetical protein